METQIPSTQARQVITTLATILALTTSHGKTRTQQRLMQEKEVETSDVAT